MKTAYDVTKHMLVPKHVKASDKDVKDLLDKYHISVYQLPKICGLGAWNPPAEGFVICRIDVGEHGPPF